MAHRGRQRRKLLAGAAANWTKIEKLLTRRA
jgi:hypothetical protein